jgi:hypothetical protein
MTFIFTVSNYWPELIPLKSQRLRKSLGKEAVLQAYPQEYLGDSVRSRVSGGQSDEIQGSLYSEVEIEWCPKLYRYRSPGKTRKY